MLWNPEACQQCGQTCSPTAALGLSPRPGFLLLPRVRLMLGWSRLPSSRKPLSPASKKGRRTSPCPGHVVGQERAAPVLGREGICRPGRLSSAESQGGSPASLLPVSGMYQVHDQIRRAERLSGKGSGLGGRKPPIAFIGSRKAWAKTSWSRRPSANEARGGCVPRGGQMPSSPTSCLDGRITHYVPGLVCQALDIILVLSYGALISPGEKEENQGPENEATFSSWRLLRIEAWTCLIPKPTFTGFPVAWKKDLKLGQRLNLPSRTNTFLGAAL